MVLSELTYSCSQRGQRERGDKQSDAGNRGRAGIGEDRFAE